MIGSKKGVSAFVHPDGVYDDAKGGKLRKVLYPKLRKHFQFQNEKKLFLEVANRSIYSLNVYMNSETNGFDSISNLFEPGTIDQCYESDGSGSAGGIKNEKDEWNTVGHKDRIIKTGKTELLLYAKFFDNNEKWEEARLPVLHTQSLTSALECFVNYGRNIGDEQENLLATQMWHETHAQNDGYIIRNVHFPNSEYDLIYSGPHISVANPCFQASQRDCSTHRAFDNIDLTSIGFDYVPRINYSPEADLDNYLSNVQDTSWNTKYTDEYRLVCRRMLNQAGERTLVAAILPPKSAHIHTMFGIAFNDVDNLVMSSAGFASLPFDFFVKTSGKSDILYDLSSKLPLLNWRSELAVRVLMLNCLSDRYSLLWEKAWRKEYAEDSWTKKDDRLDNKMFSDLNNKLNYNFALRTDFARRQALVEIDVLVAKELGMSLEQLKSIYIIQFPVLQAYEADTWYDASGRIVFTTNRSLTGVGVTRSEWENTVMKLTDGEVYEVLIDDDTTSLGLRQNKIKYVAPFDRCDRLKDYEEAWDYFDSRFMS